MIKLAETAGFCFGVDRAVNLIYDLIEKGERVCTLGPIIHNAQLVSDLQNKGVRIIDDISQCPNGYTAVIRTHGVEKSVLDDAEKYNVEYIDATCPFVSKIHNIVKNQEEGTVTLIAGDENHPEVMGIRSYCKGESFVFNSLDELNSIIENNKLSDKKPLICVSQTTFSLKEWKKCEKILKKLYTNLKIYSTICNATAERQEEALALSKECDAVIVIGGRHSSNTCKLRDVCEPNADTFLIETADELKQIDLKRYKAVGVTAGASTPSAIIKEVLKFMSQEIIEKEVEATDAVAETADTLEDADMAAVEASADDDLTFEELLEMSFQEEETGRIVKGIVVYTTPTEVYVDVAGKKQTGIVSIEDLANDPVEKPEDVVTIGKEYEFAIIKFNDLEGTIKLSKRRADNLKTWEIITDAYENKKILEGTVSKVVNGGINLTTNGYRVFVPASLCNVPPTYDLNDLVGENVHYKVISLDLDRRRPVGSLKAATMEEKMARTEAMWDSLEVGQKLTGTVKSMTPYGVFVDIGGVDGMIHVSELSWKKVKRPSQVVKIGDVVDVIIKELKEETKQISLTMKDVNNNPWEVLKRDYPVGTVCKAKIVSIANFGAFGEIYNGIDGLIHISQISWNRVKNPADVLKIGDVVDVKIIGMDTDKMRIALSMKELTEKPEETIPIPDDSKNKKKNKKTAAKKPAEEAVEAAADEAPVENAAEETVAEAAAEKPAEDAVEEAPPEEATQEDAE